MSEAVRKVARQGATGRQLGMCLSTPPLCICISCPRHMWLCLCALKYADPSQVGQCGFVMAKHYAPEPYTPVSLIEHPKFCEACRSANVLWQYLPIVGEYRYYCSDCPQVWVVFC